MDEEDYMKQWEDVNKRLTEFSSILSKYDFDFRIETWDSGEGKSIIYKLTEDKNLVFDFYSVGGTKIGIEKTEEEE